MRDLLLLLCCFLEICFNERFVVAFDLDLLMTMEI